MTLTAINRFPVKSCRGEPLASALIEPWGLQGDRRWMIIDDFGECVTTREHARMLLIEPALRSDGGLSAVAPDVSPLIVPPPSGGARIPVSVFGREPFLATLASDEAHA